MAPHEVPAETAPPPRGARKTVTQSSGWACLLAARVKLAFRIVKVNFRGDLHHLEHSLNGGSGLVRPSKYDENGHSAP